jgi:hypothetical protein
LLTSLWKQIEFITKKRGVRTLSNEPYYIIRYEEDGDDLYAIIETMGGSRFRLLIRDKNGMKF